MIDHNGASREVDFGFTRADVPAGTHVCQIFEDDDERTSAFIDFLLTGIGNGELSAGFSDHVTEQNRELLHNHPEASRFLTLQRTSDIYFDRGRFDPDRMLSFLTDFHRRATAENAAGARIIGEMAPEISTMEGADRLLEYEARVNLLVRERPMAVMCQYHAHSFNGATLMDVLKAHALMVVRGAVVRNPFYLPPESILQSLNR